MVDKIKPLKIESPSLGGTESDPFPTETDPTEDYVAAKGIALGNLDTILVSHDSVNMTFVDTVAGPATLTDLLANAPLEYILLGETLFIPQRRQAVIHNLLINEGLLNVEGTLVIFL